MRDIIWTIIVVWLIYKIVGVFRSRSSKISGNSANPNSHTTRTASSVNHDQEIKDAIRKGVNKEGDYVDFEEIK